MTNPNQPLDVIKAELVAEHGPQFFDMPVTDQVEYISRYYDFPESASYDEVMETLFSAAEELEALHVDCCLS